MHTGLMLIAVPPDEGARHVTADRQKALCGLDIPGSWYTGDAGEFGKGDDCKKCAGALRKTDL